MDQYINSFVYNSHKTHSASGCENGTISIYNSKSELITQFNVIHLYQ